MRNIISKNCLFQFPDGTTVLKDNNIIAFAGGVGEDSDGLTLYKVGLDDKLRIEGELEIADESNREGTSQFGPYAKFISQLKLVFKNVQLAIHFLNKIRTTRKL